ncbi:hypothetical protein J7K50_04020 [bacterium]|nr:hypothetical protein [bacterium]
MKFRPRRRSPLLLTILALIIVGGVVMKYAVLSSNGAPHISAVRNGELNYIIGPLPPDYQSESGVMTQDETESTPPSIIPRENPDVTDEESVKPENDAEAERKTPAEFKDSGYFAGGKVDNGIMVTGFRFGKHPDFRRIVIDFGVVDRESGRIVQTEVLPKYKVEYRTCPYRYSITFSGVNYYDDAIVQRKNALPFSLVADSHGRVMQLEFFITRPAMFKVIEVDDPARLALDIKFKNNVDIPRINVVQVIGIESVERAFELLDTGRFPECFEPQIVVIGDKFFIEGIYDTFERAVQVSAELEKFNFSTIISERKGNAFPVDE